MIQRSTLTIGLIILLIGYIVAEVDTERSPRAVPANACQEHTRLHNRLDVVEKKVEDTVGKLEAELAALLEAIQDPKWHPQLDNTGIYVDILEDPVNAKP